jgi:hypothetical protein
MRHGVASTAIPLELAVGSGAVHRYRGVTEREVWREAVVDAGNRRVRKAKESNNGGRIMTKDWERGDPGYEVIKSPRLQRGGE